MAQKRLISMEEVLKHNTEQDCWIVFHDKVYDITSFLPEHPGGIPIIAAHSGKVATAVFDQIHPKSMLKLLPSSAYIGDIDKSTINAARGDVASTGRDENVDIPPLDQLINTFDFKAAASKCMTKQGWNYYISGAEDEITFRENMAAFGRYLLSFYEPLYIVNTPNKNLFFECFGTLEPSNSTKIWFRPRVLVDVSNVDISSKILGFPTEAPFYATACALGKLAHPDGEVAITRACGEEGIIQMIPTLASSSMDEMCQAAQSNQVQFLQLYVNQNRDIAKKSIAKAKGYGVKAVCITVDAPQLGRRERDMRQKLLSLKDAPKLEKENYSKKYKQRKKAKKKTGGVAASISQFIDPSLNWKDLEWIKRECGSMKVVLKGVQCGEDAVLAVEHGVDAIVLSNHGGRQLDYGRSGIEILAEVMEHLEANSMKNRIEVWVDGGIRRGTDIFKALALGASCVGIGRPFLFGMACYGQDGVAKVMQIFKNEFEVCMQMMGCQSVKDIKRSMIIYKNLGDHITLVPENRNAYNVYTPLPRVVELNSKL